MPVHNGGHPSEILEEVQEDELLRDDGVPAEHAHEVMDRGGPLQHHS